MPSLDVPVSAPLVNHQNQLRFWALSFASVSNTNNSPAATRNHSRCLLPFAKVMAQLCLLQAFISCSPHCLHTDRHRHMVTLHIRAGRTWHVWELPERSVLPQTLLGPPLPVRGCAAIDTDRPSPRIVGLVLLCLETVPVFWVPLRARPPVVIFWLGVSLIKAHTCPRHSSGKNSGMWPWSADIILPV